MYRRRWEQVVKAALAMFGLVMLAMLALPLLPALAAEEELVPLVDRLPNQVLVFGASGGAIVSLLISILKHFGFVGGARGIPPQAANFILSVLVAAVAGILGGQSFGMALLTAFTSMIAASGLHETVGHAAARVVGNR